MGFPGGASGNESACQWRRRIRGRFNPWVGKLPWRRAWRPTPVLAWRIPWTEEPGRLHSRVTKSRTRLKRLNTHTLDRYTLLKLCINRQLMTICIYHRELYFMHSGDLNGKEMTCSDPIFKKESYSETLGVRASTYEFGEDNSTHNTPSGNQLWPIWYDLTGPQDCFLLKYFF